MAKRGPKVIPFKGLQAEPLTIETFKSYEGCEHYSDQQASQIIASLRQYATILLKVVLKKEATHTNIPATHPDNHHHTICLSERKKAA